MLFPFVLLVISDENDREFMQKLYITYHISMFRMARSLTDSMADAEDVVSAACLSLIKKISYLRTVDCNILEGYIISTVKNEAFLLHRRNMRHHKSNEAGIVIEQIAAHEATPEEIVLEKSTIEELMNCIAELPEDDQLVLRMKYFHKETDEEIAKILGVRKNTVRSKTYRARQRIMRILKEKKYEK